MNIAMFTNTYLPHVGGVAQSVQRFARAFRRRGHRVLIAAPRYPEAPDSETGVVRVPALQHFNGSDFSVALPLSLELADELRAFAPDLLHSHHPFLLGNTALRAAAKYDVPLVFTHHTMYECYTHYAPLDLPAFRTYIQRLATGYANLCDGVVAPSESVARILRQRGVVRPVQVAATGVDLKDYAAGDAAAARTRFGIPDDAFLIGHVGRLAPEKNLDFLAPALAEALEHLPTSRLLVVGSGPSVPAMRQTFRERGVGQRVVFAGTLVEQELVDAYHAMDVFAFASKTETQGMVLVEALATGCPVVAIDAAGAREVVQDESNGRLLEDEDPWAFAQALAWVAGLGERQRRALKRRAARSAKPFSTSRCAKRVLRFYREILARGPLARRSNAGDWPQLLRAIRREWELWANKAKAAGEAIAGNSNST
ncbi:MAG: glycosyltransferase [bacterium]